MTDQPAGPLLDNLGVTFALDDGDQITEALVLGKVTNFDTGDTGLVIATSDGLDWIAQHGLLHAGRIILDRDHASGE